MITEEELEELSILFRSSRDAMEVERLIAEVRRLREENTKLQEYKFMYEGLCK